MDFAIQPRVSDWTSGLTAEHGSPVVMVAVALLFFPKLALGMSGFETGVAVMPHVRGDSDDDARTPRGTHPRHQAAAHDRRDHHERLPRHEQHHHDVADPQDAFD